MTSAFTEIGSILGSALGSTFTGFSFVSIAVGFDAVGLDEKNEEIDFAAGALAAAFFFGLSFFGLIFFGLLTFFGDDFSSFTLTWADVPLLSVSFLTGAAPNNEFTPFDVDGFDVDGSFLMGFAGETGISATLHFRSELASGRLMLQTEPN